MIRMESWAKSFITGALIAGMGNQPLFEAAAQTNSTPPSTEETAELIWKRDWAPSHEARMRWWRDARFGMFIHWGVYSVPAGVWKGDQSKHIGEWLMRDYNIPVAEYGALTKQFNPVKFNAEEWVKLAKDAGMKYIVITSKHHDGFAMFHSKVSPYNIHDATPFKRDPLAELAKACKKEGIKLGFYYSQAQDWHHPGGAAANKNTERNIDKENHWDVAQQGGMDDYVDKIAIPQLKEILTNYGPVAELWFDTPVAMTSDRAKRILPLLKLQPAIVVNNRLDSARGTGDFSTPEQRIPATGIPGKDFEACMTMNTTWGYKSFDDNWKSTETLVRNLIDIASKGGNYLLNVGPTSEGVIPQPSVERLKQVGQWIKANGDALYGTTASPFSRLAWGRCTKKLGPSGATLYLHVFDWPADGKLLVPGLQNAVKSATLLATRAKLKAAKTSQGWTVTVPSAPPDKISSTVVLHVEGPLKIEQLPIVQEGDGSVTLLSGDARYGPTIKRVVSGFEEYLGSWSNPSDTIEWTFKVKQPGKFTVAPLLASTSISAIEVSAAGQSFTGKVGPTGGATTFRNVELGTVDIKSAGDVTLRLRGVQDGWQPVNIELVKLKPVN